MQQPLGVVDVDISVKDTRSNGQINISLEKSFIMLGNQQNCLETTALSLTCPKNL